MTSTGFERLSGCHNIALNADMKKDLENKLMSGMKLEDLIGGKNSNIVRDPAKSINYNLTGGSGLGGMG